MSNCGYGSQIVNVPPAAGADELAIEEPDAGADAAGDPALEEADDEPAGADDAAPTDEVDEVDDDPDAVLEDEHAASEPATAKAVKAVNAVRRTVEERVTLILPWMQFVWRPS